MSLAKRNPVIHVVFLLCCGLEAGRSFKPRQSSGLLVPHCAPLSVGKVLGVSPCAGPFVYGSEDSESWQGCSLGTVGLVGISELRDGPSKQTVAASNC